VRALSRLLKLILLLALALGGAAVWWLQHPLPMPADTVDLSIEPGRTPRGVAQDVANAGVAVDPRVLYLWFRLSGQDRLIRAGSYELDRATTPYKLLAKLVRGDEALGSVTLVEGWNFRQVRAALAKAEKLKPDSAGMSDEAVMQALGRSGLAPEGRFFPDSYTYSKGSSDIALLRRALRAMDKRLDTAWAERTPDTPLRSPGDALVLASIVEKETGRVDDRARIAGVFTNRLKIGMPLQTDPSVIYGMGTAFDGNLRKKDLLADTPWNTYTRTGLPPTPIAMPGRAALLAAVRPEATKALYFVSRGDGSSQFSPTLDEHNRAVDQYQRNPVHAAPAAPKGTPP
jgi:UPF0755 protein